jgi:NAD(P)-dependent dehydrogenase (short-subunit alcohol dehydrogenase family)
MAGQMQGKVAFVTGAGAGMGRASSLAFAKEGAKVIVTDIDVDGGNETVKLIKQAGGEAVFVKVDVAHSAEIQTGVNKAVEIFGRLDYAHNNVGLYDACRGDIVELTEEVWDRTTSVNLKSMWLGMKYEIPLMLRTGGGAIVNTSSGAGLKGVPLNPLYSTHKHGVIGLTRSAALAYAKKGIRINCVCAGITATPTMLKNLEHNKELAAALPRMVPQGAIGRPEEIAAAVVWLCSDAASHVVGHTMVVDGGEVIQ